MHPDEQAEPATVGSGALTISSDEINILIYLVSSTLTFHLFSSC